jgi:pimeloyl-ACP methyl ester carboxylesterase
MLTIALACALQVVVVQGPAQAQWQQRCLYPPSLGEFTIPNVSATGKSETYWAWGPSSAMGPAPLLMLFHSYQKDHLEWQKPIWDNYDLIDEAVDRGWYVVMHDGGESSCVATPPSYTTYGEFSFQRHTEAVISNMMCRFNIDKERVYGYGLSMGGEEALVYAARHRNPNSNQGFFAAVVNHSGYYSPIYQVSGDQQGSPGCGPLPGCLYDGDDYCTDPFKWRQATVLDLEPITCPGTTYNGVWPPTTAEVSFYNSQIQNLARTPLRTYYADAEPLCLRQMNDLLASWLGQYYGVTGLVSEFDCVTSNCMSDPPDCTPSAHMWDAVCADDALNFLEGHTRTSTIASAYAGQGIILCAEDNKRYYDFKVVRTNSNDFGRIHWFKPSSSGSIGFLAPNPMLGSATHNIAELTILAGSPWIPFLDSTQDVEIRTKWSMKVHVGGYPNPPSDVVLVGSGSQTINHDPQKKTVTFTTGNGDETWIIIP